MNWRILIVYIFICCICFRFFQITMQKYDKVNIDCCERGGGMEVRHSGEHLVVRFKM